MTPNEKKICSGLLQLAADHFSNHGNNDFKLDDTHDNLVLIREMQTNNNPEHTGVVCDEGKLITIDHDLMSYFANVLDKEATENFSAGHKNTLPLEHKFTEPISHSIIRDYPDSPSMWTLICEGYIEPLDNREEWFNLGVAEDRAIKLMIKKGLIKP